MSLDHHSPLFRGPISEWTNDQKHLLYWLSFYNKYAFSLDEDERPAEHIIRYNALMDEYVERKIFKEREERRRQQRHSGGSKTIERFDIDGN